MKYLSLFSGIGGFELGIQNSNVDVPIRSRSEQRRLDMEGNNSATDDQPMGSQQPHTCVGFSEIDKYAIQIYQSHFPEHKNYGDITKIKAEELPDFDLLVGGFPCQSFSIAGKRKGFEDTRGTLFFDVARILQAKRPRLFVLENVKGLLSHDGGKTFATIVSAITEVGYDCQWQVLNSRNHGVPQNRERIFIVGHLRGTARPEVFPFGHNDEISDQEAQSEARQSQTSHTLRGSSVKADQVFIGTLRTHKDGEGFREMKNGNSRTIPARAREDGSGQPIIKKGMKIRRLTPVECERLQGFPDGWTNGVSDTQRYKTLGNAVTTNVVQAVMERLINPHSKYRL